MDAGGLDDIDADAKDAGAGFEVKGVHRCRGIGAMASTISRTAVVEAGEEGAGDDGVADVQFGEVGDGEDLGDVGVIDAVAGVDLEAEAVGEAGGADEALEFALLVLAGGVGKGAGVEFDASAPRRWAASICSGSGSMKRLTRMPAVWRRRTVGSSCLTAPTASRPPSVVIFAAVLGDEADFLRAGCAARCRGSRGCCPSRG